MIDVTALDREALARACERYGVARLRVFGSAVTGAFDPAASDLDFLVDFNADAPRGVGPFLDLKDELQRIAGRNVDLIEARGAQSLFRQPRIRRGARRLCRLTQPRSCGTHSTPPARSPSSDGAELRMPRTPTRTLTPANAAVDRAAGSPASNCGCRALAPAVRRQRIRPAHRATPSPTACPGTATSTISCAAHPRLRRDRGRARVRHRRR